MIELEIERMLKARIIERSTSSYCNPLRIVQRSDGNIRICLDARFINNIIESENEAPPRISEILQKFHGIKYISTSDLANGYLPYLCIRTLVSILLSCAITECIISAAYPLD